MKVLFGIATLTHGAGGGGHAYSLRVTAETISEHVSVMIMNIGWQPFKPLVATTVPFEFVPYRGIMGTLLASLKIVRKFRPDVLHAFDRESLFFMRAISILTGIKLVFTKCGGPNPSGYYPHVRDLVVYSKENYEYFTQNKGNHAKRVYLIPNRVGEIIQDHERINQLKKILNFNGCVFLRVARISRFHERSFYQSINLVRRLRADGIDAKLVIIGSVQEPAFYKELSSAECPYVRIITEAMFTVDANQLIDIADFVIGAGRSFMEASILGKIALCPNRNLSIPVLATPETISVLEFFNFSDRTEIVDMEEHCYGVIRDVLQDETKKRKLGDFLRNYAYENFHVKNLYSKYIQVYENAEPEKVCSFTFPNLLRHMIFTHRSILSVMRRDRR